MKIIGITGGVGAGKTTVLNLLKELCACRIIMADDVAKSLMVQGEILGIKAVGLFGKEAFNTDGSLNTVYMSAIMYNNADVREQWTKAVHPAVNIAIHEEIDRTVASGEYDFMFIEAALLIENGYDRICDEIWYIYTDEEVRIQRLLVSRGYTREKSLSIMKCQMSHEKFKSKCAFIIDNGISVEHTRKQLENKLEEY